MRSSGLVWIARSRSVWSWVLFFCLMTLSAPTIRAQPISRTALDQIAALAAEKAARTPAQRKISSRLLYEGRMRLGVNVARGVRTLRRSIAVTPQGTTLVDIRATVSPGVLAAIRASGGEIINSFAKYGAIRARIPLDQLETIANRSDIQFIRPADRAITRKDNTSLGDVTHATDLARSQMGIDGSGVTIGVLSDGVDARVTVAASGDIPPDCPAGPPCVEYLAGQLGSGSEGTAMLEIVFDLAPGADLKFATAFSGQASFAQNILDLATAGSDIIVDDVFYFSEPVFQDGIIAQAVNDVFDNGVVYISASGNEGSVTNGSAGVWEGDFVPVAAPGVIGGTAHDFGAGANYNTITTDPPFGISLHWSDAMGASGNDYDLYLLNPARTVVLDSSTNTQNGNDDPFEFIDSEVGDDTGNTLVVIRSSGAARYLHMTTVRGELAIATEGQMSGHSAAKKTISVAAVRVSTSGCSAACVPFMGGAANYVEGFSSDGPRQLFYEVDGTPITPGNFLAGGGEILQKPDLAAADGIKTNTPGFGTFFGTSAAAPHVAGIAGLLIEQNEALRDNPTGMRDALTDIALDIEGPGLDTVSGAGVVVFETCGNGNVNSGETCDDSGMTPGDGCGMTCQVEIGWSCAGAPSVCGEICGDGMIIGSETCDDSGTTPGDGCDANCQIESGYVCAGEPSICSPEVCGDGVITVSETCDDAGTTPGDGCDASCQIELGYVCVGEPSVCSLEVCGDGVITVSETCDDAGTLPGDGCDASCQIESGYSCIGEPSLCSEGCGDGIITVSETCDDAGTTPGDGCGASCQIESGFSCSGEPSVCSEICGDGIITVSETCDDAGTTPGDGCDASCQIESGYGCAGEPSACSEICGDGIITVSEACDDAGTAPGDGCDASCQIESGYGCVGEPSACSETCGDGIITVSEACDDAGTTPGDGCGASCQIESGFGCVGEPSVCSEVCGDGVISVSEGCDDAGTTPGDGCDASCQIESGYGCAGQPSVCSEICGDGLLTGGETCDDAGTAPGDGCDASCQIESGYSCVGEPSVCAEVCGDGVITVSEACDDAGVAPGDGCDANCQIEPNFGCFGEPSTCARFAPALWGTPAILLVICLAMLGRSVVKKMPFQR